MKKSSNLWKVIWVLGIYAVLCTILYLVILYKVEWEDKDLNTYLYFYDCNNALCTSTYKQDNYYNKIMCEDNICPYITNINSDNLVLKKDDNSWIYNYVTNTIVNNAYKEYKYLNNDNYVFTDNYNKQGVLNLSDGVLIQSEYDYIDDYLNGFVSYKLNGLYGIDSPNDLYNVNPEYEKIVLINDKMFSGRKGNEYYIYDYNNVGDSDNKYNFVYADNNIIFVFDNKKIDILDTNLDSVLLMKLNSFYEYTTEKERDSLNFYFDGENIAFDVFINEKEYTTYKFNVLTKKII